MRYREVDVIGEEYASDNRHWSAQHMVNRLPVPAERAGTRTRWMAPQAPGLKPLVHIYRNLGETIEESGPVRGGREVEGKLFVVAGTTLWQISNDYVAIPLGTIPGIGRVSLTHNQRGLANEVLILTGSSGYIYNTGTMTLTRITDDSFPGGSVGFFIEGFFGVVDPQGRFWQSSERGDGLSWSSLSRYEAPGQPDKIVTAIESFREAIIFGARSTEFYVNRSTEDGNAPFDRARNTGMAVGCAAKFSIAQMDNTVWWLDEKRIVRRKDGYTPVRVSTQAIEQALAECTAEQIAAAFAFVWEDKGHKVYYLTVPGKFTLGYDVLSGRWHRRLTKGMERWRLADLWFWNGKWVGGDYQSGRLYELDWKYAYDGQDSEGNPLDLVRRTASGYLSANQNRLRVHSVQFIVRGDGAITIPVNFPAQPQGPSLSGNAPNGSVGFVWPEFEYVASGGTAPYRFELRSGSLPAGFSRLGVNGTIPESTPTRNGSYTYTIRVYDANGLYTDLTDTIVIALPMLMSAISGASGTVMIPSPDGVDWSASPIASSNVDGPFFAHYMSGLPGRYWGRRFQTASVGAYSDNQGVDWSETAGNVVAGAWTGQDAYTDGKLYLPTHVAGSYFVSYDDGVSLDTLTGDRAYLVALNETDDRLAAIDGSNVKQKFGGTLTWTAGAAHGFTASPAVTTLCGTSDGTNYLYGGSNGTVPRLISFQNDIVTPITLPTPGLATGITAIAHGNGITIAGTDAGTLYVDSGSGFVAGGSVTDRVSQIFWNGAVFVILAKSIGVGSVHNTVDGMTVNASATYGALEPLSITQMRPE